MAVACDIVPYRSYISYHMLVFFFFFFFQAEDGIRDLTVTGVQTCALPILPDHRHHPPAMPGAGHARGPVRRPHRGRTGPGRHRGRGLQHRSEEHTSELQSQSNLVCRLLLEKKKKKKTQQIKNKNTAPKEGCIECKRHT